jgi:hypothetical protein
MKCDNCENEASYTTADPGVNPANYCTSCLPAWLRERAEAGHFPLMAPVEEPKKKAPAKKTPTDENN